MTHDAPMPALTPKQQRFVDEYLIDVNATQAAIRAGYSERTANQQGPRLLEQPGIVAAIDAAKIKRSDKLKVDAAWVLKRLVEEAEADLADLYDADNNLKPVEAWPAIWRQGLVAGVEVEALFEGFGKERVQVGYTKKIKISDRVRRLELIGKHISVNAFQEQVKVGGLEGLGDRLERAHARALAANAPSASRAEPANATRAPIAQPSACPAPAAPPPVPAALFEDDASQFDEKPIAGFFNTFALSARSDGDVERAEALSSAGEALIADARKAGTDAAELTSALDIVSERQGDTLSPITPEKMEAEFASGMAAIQQEYGDTYMADLSAARAFIKDLEIIAPGTIDSLERTGAGNDMRLIRSAIKEAKRRGYR